MKKQRILIAEDDPNFGMMLKSYLSVNGYEVELCDDGNKAFSAFRNSNFDLCIFDVMMPYKDGFSLAASVKSLGSGVPFIFLTAKALKEDQVRGYELGAADYLIKPFDPEILLLKIEVLLSLGSPAIKPSRLKYVIGSFTFTAESRLLQLGPKKTKLSPKEADLLAMLANNLGQVLIREDALNQIWKEDSYFTTKSMDVYITKLRKYLREDPVYKIEITNLHGKGFVLSVNKIPEQ